VIGASAAGPHAAALRPALPTQQIDSVEPAVLDAALPNRSAAVQCAAAFGKAIKMAQKILSRACTLHRRRSSSVDGSSRKGTGTATGGQGPAALTTCGSIIAKQMFPPFLLRSLCSSSLHPLMAWTAAQRMQRES
jgi:hypothetical protein